MNANDLRAWRNQQPFTPFEISTRAGDRYPVYQPTAVLIQNQRLLVGTDYETPDDLPASHQQLTYPEIAAVRRLQGRLTRKSSRRGKSRK